VVDVAIVGAGAAGLGAAQALSGTGLRFVVLEAKDRIGGRAHTEYLHPGIPFDHGCYWLHSGGLNPLAVLAGRLGFAVRRGQSRKYPPLIFLGRGWASAAEASAWRRFESRTSAAVDAVGGRGLDLPVSDFVDETSSWAPLYAAWTSAVSGVSPRDTSTLDLARYRDTGENWPVRDGFGALVARIGMGLPVRLGTPVQRVDWSGTTPRLETAHGTIEARVVIITVSTAVLASGRMAFSPELPSWKRDAIAGLPLGMANKVALVLRPNALGAPRDRAAHVLANPEEPIHFQIQPFGRDFIVGHIGGDFAAALEREGTAATIDFAIERLSGMFGGTFSRHVIASRATAWKSDAWIGGGYSAARPGEAHRRDDLAAPLGERVFFAGEATSREFYSTAHGAYLSGIAAARRAMDLMKA
jgi:monoamine oxidase